MSFIERVKARRADLKARAGERRQRVASDLAIIIAKAQLKRKEVAQKLDITEAALSIRLNGTANLTLDSIGGICDATGFEFDVHFRRPDEAPALSFWEIEEASDAAGPASAKVEVIKVDVDPWLTALESKSVAGLLYDVPCYKPAAAANETMAQTTMMKYEAKRIAA